MIESIPPGWILILGAFCVPLLRGTAQKAWLVGLPIVSGIHTWLLPETASLQVSLFSGTHTLELVRVDAISRLFGIVFHIAALLSAIYALHVENKAEKIAGLAYAGSAIAAAFAGDLITFFVFWEATAITSVFLIWARGTERAYRTGMRYLVIQVGSGVLLLAGSVIHYATKGSLAFDVMHLYAADPTSGREVLQLGPALIFAAFGIKAAFPLLHNWLQDAYPEATVSGTVFLSAFTTKLAIYALWRGFPGTEILIPIGAAMTAFPIFYAVIENDLRRVLAYSLNNQLGYMVVGVGIGTELALNGTAAHAFAHILYKGLLFMSIGAVLYRTGTANGSDLGGLYKSMPITATFCIIGAAAISAFPLFSGFVSKSMILSAAAEEHHTWTYLVLLFASAGVFHHSGIKIPYFAFFGHDRGHRVEEAPRHMLVAMGLAALLCVGIGVFYQPLYALLPFASSYVPYTTDHVVTSTQLLMFSALAFTVLMRTGIYPPELHSVNLDFDWVYRRVLPRAIAAGGRAYVALAARAETVTTGLRTAIAGALWRVLSPAGRLGEPWPTGETAMWAAMLLGLYLVIYYI